MGSFSLEVVSTQSKIDVNRRMNMEIQTWQYAVRTQPDTENVESERHEQFMNELGAEGW